MRRIAIIGLALMLGSGVLAGCGGGDESQPPSAEDVNAAVEQMSEQAGEAADEASEAASGMAEQLGGDS